MVQQTKSRKGLTLNGIACQIVNAILLWERGVPDNDKYGTRNDCHLVINRLIREYHDRLEVERRIAPAQYTPKALAAKARKERLVKEHAVPVACIMRELIDRQCKAANGDMDALVPKVHEILLSTARRTYIAQEENQALRGYEDRMPEGHEIYPWQNIWIRHERAGIPLVHLKATALM